MCVHFLDIVCVCVYYFIIKCLRKMVHYCLGCFILPKNPTRLCVEGCVIIVGTNTVHSCSTFYTLMV